MQTNITVGQQVVIMDVYIDGPLAPNGTPRGVPVAHDSRHEHECRGKVLKIGRKLLHVETRGAPWKLLPYQPNTNGRFAVPVAEAKVLYRAGFGGPEEYRTQEFIDQCVESL